jgi:acetyl esterase/lipase
LAAPATELGALMRADMNTPGGNNLLAMTLWSWDRVFGAPMHQIVNADAIPTVDRLAHICIESPIDLRPRAAMGASLQEHFLKVGDPTTIEPWHTLLAENTVGMPPAPLALLVAQGTADETVDPPVTADYVKKLCANGNMVQRLLLPGVGHGMAGRDSATAATQWMSDRFAGKSAPNDCGRL